jgi:2-polyprenyl-6-methoxyphenol hydroxylase-like FAD-dependent oxidoreductase
MRVLISGASIAGPVLAYWLTRYGFEVTVVERAPVLRKTGGHAVDLFRPAMDISERMGLVADIEKQATHMERGTMYRQGAKPVRVDLGKVFEAASDRHVEIFRDDLSEIYYEAARDKVEYIFGDSITGIDDGDVTFEHGPPRRFDIIVGADGVHSNVRGLVFGAVEKLFIGAHLAVFTVPKHVGVEGEYVLNLAVGRICAVYSAPHMPDGRALFLFRGPRLDYHHRDVPRQKELLRQAYRGMPSIVNKTLAELDDTPAFYFDSITQLRMETWSRGRVTLVGDAAYCPGAAVGGSTSMAVIGAYVLAGELAAADGDYEKAFVAYEREMIDLVRQSRAMAISGAKRLVPGTRTGLWALARGMQLASVLPTSALRLLTRLNSNGLRTHDSMAVKQYADLRIG